MKALAITVALVGGLQIAVPQSKVRIEGDVVSLDSKQPIQNAEVLLLKGPVPPQEVGSRTPFCTIRATGGGTMTAGAPRPLAARPGTQMQLTDAQGSFAFESVDAGDYRLVVSRDGYARQEFGQISPGSPGSVLRVAPGLKSVVIPLVRSGAVSGRVTGPAGVPLPGFQVQLVQARYDALGQRVFEAHRIAGTNDRGEYRLFDVVPGRYYLVAGCPDFPMRGALGGYPWVVYPHTGPSMDLASAVPVEVSPGSDMGSMDFLLDKTISRAIRGRIVDTNGNSPKEVGLSIQYAPEIGGGGTTPDAPGYNSSNGTFEFPDLVPGRYYLMAGVRASATTPFMRAVASIVVSNSDVNDVVLRLSPNSLQGLVKIDGTATLRDLGRFAIDLRPEPGRGNPGITRASPNAAGELKFDGLSVPEYRVVPFALPSGYYLKSAFHDGVDVLERPLRVSAALGASPLVVTVGTDVARVDGTVRRSDGHPADGTVVLVPRQRSRSELFQTVNTHSAGQYSFASVAPGDYKVFAWETLTPYAYFGEDFLKPVEDLGKAISVVGSAKVRLDVDLVPTRTP